MLKLRQIKSVGWLRQLPLLVLCLLVLRCATASAQAKAGPTKPSPASATTTAEAPKDTLGRNTPRGAVLGFMNASRKKNAEIAVLYLNTPLRGEAAHTLAHQLAVVLDRRLPARLNEISDQPDGSLRDPLRPDEDLIGTITTANGDLDVMVERVDRGKMGRVWVFSRKTLDAIPQVFQEITTPPVEKLLPAFLVETRIADIPLFEWLAVLVGMPFLYLLTGWLSLAVSTGVRVVRRHPSGMTPASSLGHLPPPIRFLIVAGIIRWLLSRVGLPLLARQFWSTVAASLAVIACVWMLLMLNGIAERYLLHRGSRLSGSASVLRLVRRALDGLVLFASVLLALNHFGVNVTAALAGLGVGGIAVALAAQKTLENVIGGISLIADQVVRVGDFLKLGDVVGTVEQVGLRSTRIRTLDRTLVSMPNGQIANMSLETFSVRDKFWFHHVVGLRYQTTSEQVQSITAGIRTLLTQEPRIEPESVRVRLLRFGAYSMELDLFAYIVARDWNHFLEIQEQLLVHIMNEIEQARAQIAIPSQTLYLSGDSRGFAALTKATPELNEIPATALGRAKSA